MEIDISMQCDRWVSSSREGWRQRPGITDPRCVQVGNEATGMDELPKAVQ